MASLGQGAQPVVALEPEPEPEPRPNPNTSATFDNDNDNDNDNDDDDDDGSEIRVRYKLSIPTYRTLCGLPRAPERRDVLQAACQAHEFRTFPIRAEERGLLRAINEQTGIPYAIRGEALAQPWHKVFLLAQAEMARANGGGGGSGWPAGRISGAGRRALAGEARRMRGLLEQVLRCAADVLGSAGRRDGRGVAVALDVLRSVRAGVWEGAGTGAGAGAGAELLQVEGIGRAYAGRLAAAGVRTVRRLAGMEFYHIERVVGRNPPFGHEVLARVSGFPRLTLRVGRAERCVVLGGRDEKKEENLKGKEKEKEMWAVRVRMGYENEKVPSWRARSPVVTLVMEGADGRLLWFWRGGVKRLEGGKEIVVGLEGDRGERVRATLACEEIVGTVVRHEFCI
ncbi:hypothetical protein ESCO_003795 [Escovopsis weberi]|uniref:SEC63 domain-containing protein n=1 Tax=Escovopsis weberi TaxID=150374 RepID=A0A0M8N153_ESCWE|nr:hypothetical protein ESCO_003795 [Escovopsis weberi]